MLAHDCSNPFQVLAFLFLPKLFTIINEVERRLKCVYVSMSQTVTLLYVMRRMTRENLVRALFSQTQKTEKQEQDIKVVGARSLRSSQPIF